MSHPPTSPPLRAAAGVAGDVAIEEFLAPRVTAVVITHDPGPALETTLASLEAQDYPGLSVLVVDNGSDRDPTERIEAVLPSADVRRIGASVGFGAAANEALGGTDGAAFLCICHDDVALDPGAIRLMVEEAYRSNAAICGPKLVDFDRPEVLLEVGRVIDRFGGAHTGIEPGELDQEQHDAVRDVFYVSSATMLVRADLFSTIGGFDPEAFPGSEDLDLCWRARLAGARVLVVPDARVRHREAAAERRGGTDVVETARRRVRTLFTCYSLLSLVWIVPFGLVASFVEALVFAFTRRRRAAFAELRAWWWNVLHPLRIRSARRRAQQHRTIHDADLRELQLGWVARVQSFLTHHHADERMESIGDRLQTGVDALVGALRHPGTIAFTVFLLVLAVGSRKLMTDGVPAVGSLVGWSGPRAMLDAFGSAWHYTGLGAAKPASGALAGMAGLTAVTFGNPGFAQTALVIGVFVVGPLGVARLVRRLGANRGPAMTGAILYGVNPVARNAFANGRLGPLVLFAAAPFIVLGFIRAAGFAGVLEPGRRVRATFGLGVVLALTIAFFPPAVVFVAVVAAAFLMGSILTGRDVVASLRGSVIAAFAVVVAGVLLLPWSATAVDFRHDRGAFGFSFWFRDLSLADVARFHTGPSGAGVASWGIYAAAVFALVVASGPRLAWVARHWMLVVGGIAVAYVPSQLWPNEPVPALEGGLVAAALGLAVAAGLGIGAFGDELRRAHFGWRQLAALLAGAGIVLAAVGFAADAVGGRWHSARAGWDETLPFVEEQPGGGEFRILWVGDPAVLPTDPFTVRNGLAYAVTVDGAGNARELLRAPRADADAILRRSVALALDGRTSRLGRLVAPMGVRYVAAPSRSGPGGARGAPIPGLRARLAEQLDLAELQVPPGLVLYENTAWFPTRGVAGKNADVPRGNAAPIPIALRTDLAGAVAPLDGKPVGPGDVLLAQAYDDDWEAASASGTTLRHHETFGWANGFGLPARSVVDVKYAGQGATNLMVAGQALLWLVVIVVAWRGRSRRPRPVRTVDADSQHTRREQAEARRRVREEQRAQAELETLDDDFWSRR